MSQNDVLNTSTDWRWYYPSTWKILRNRGKDYTHRKNIRR